VIDDPFKNWRDAQSLKIREAVWDWYLTTFSTRLWENARELLIMTRWHPDDLVGRILNDPKRAGRWEVANFPALAEPENAALPGWRPDTLGRESGEPLAPSRYSAEYLRVKQEEQGSIKWGSLYQQRPTVVEGGVIKVGKFVMRDGVPDDLVRSVRFWDLASTPEGAGADPDYTAGALMGQTARGNWVILSMIHGRLSPNTTRERFKQTAATDGQSVPIVIEQEPGSSGAFAISDLVSMVPGWNARGERASGPQLSRVLPFAAQVEAGNIELVRGPWVPAFIEECRSYRGDGSTHDDQVVAAAGAFRFLHSPAVALSTPSDDAEPDPELEVTEWDS
jgi:predicted phage terminase large subunit-like protein